MRFPFRWIDWNRDHIAQHGISTEEAEYVVENAQPPYPREIGEDKYLAIGQTASGRYIQVIYIFDPPGVVFVIHARPLTEREKRRYRRRKR